uniref:Uncharacterized protein n=1 Tax=Anguilla anguilla TaxID=7936 RepID=A0A0E9X0C0_ANGAN
MISVTCPDRVLLVMQLLSLLRPQDHFALVPWVFIHIAHGADSAKGKCENGLKSQGVWYTTTSLSHKHYSTTQCLWYT